MLTPKAQCPQTTKEPAMSLSDTKIKNKYFSFNLIN